jgi:hypothetical protein
VSPILYLLYNTPLLEGLEELVISISPLGFVDDITLLTYSDSTAKNCKTLKRAYQYCLEWASRHGSIFNAEKSELIHFTRGKGHDKSITLENSVIEPLKSIKFLGVYINRDLTPTSHINYLKGRIPGLLGQLQSLTTSTWGIKLEIARSLYLRAIRPALAYGAIAWYPIATKTATIGNTLESWQGKFLRRILGAYKATAITALEIESYTEPLDLYIERQVAIDLETQALRQRDSLDRMKLEIETKIRLLRRRTTRTTSIPIEPYYRRSIEYIQQQSNPPTQPLGSPEKKDRRKLKKALEKASIEQWKNRWTTSSKGRAIHALRPIPDPKSLDLYKDRAKSTSSILIQLRSQKIGLQAFLYRRKVPGIDSPICPYCQEEEETAQHFILHCPKWRRERTIYLGDYTTRNLDTILQGRKSSIRAVRFLIATNRLAQFQATSLELEET